jgi:foldase protein PrsA
MDIKIGKICRIMASAMAVLILMAGCTQKDAEVDDTNTNTKVVLTTGLGKDEVFRIEGESCTLSEIMVYLTNTKNQYEDSFGSEIWNVNSDDMTISENVKENVLARVARIKSLNLMAKQYEITLDEDENQKAAQAGEAYYNSLNDTEKSLLNVTQEDITNMYSEYALAGKVYEYLIADINPEISDDEARTITVQHILIKTYTLNEDGERVPYSENAKKEARQKAQEALEKAKNGEDFTLLIAQYSEDTNDTYTFGKGSMDEDFEEASFNLGTDEISDIVESDHGFHIIKCISTFNRSETDRNKVKIVEQRRKEVFNEEYSKFVAGLTKSLNEKLWESVEFIDDENVDTSSFFTIYKDIFMSHTSQ